MDSFVIMAVLGMCSLFAAPGVIPVGPWDEGVQANVVAVRDIWNSFVEQREQIDKTLC